MKYLKPPKRPRQQALRLDNAGECAAFTTNNVKYWTQFVVLFVLLFY